MKNLCFILLLLQLFISCTKNHKNHKDEVKTLHLMSYAEIKGFDPIQCDDLPSADEISKIYEGLYEYHWLKTPQELVPNLALALPVFSNNNLTMTIKLRQKVFFQNDKAFPNGKGRELNAHDFIYSMKRLADSKNASGLWSLVDGKIKGLNEWREKNSKLPKTNYEENIQGLSALDNYTLQVELTKPFPQFTSILAGPAFFIVAKEVVDFYGKDFLNHPVGTGPYTLPIFDHSLKLTYTKNPTFRDKFYPSEASPGFLEYTQDKGKKLPLVDRVVVEGIKEATTQFLKFNNGEIDLINVPKDNFSNVVANQELSPEFKKKGYKLNIFAESTVSLVGINFSNKLMQNKKLRQAMYASIDYDKLNVLFNNGTGTPAHSMITSQQVGYEADYVNPYRGLNLELAKKLIAEAGYPNGKGLPTIVMDLFDSPTSRQYGEFYQKQFSQIGVDLKLEASPWPTFLERLRGNKTVLFLINFGAIYPDAQSMLQFFYSKNIGGLNEGRYINPEFDKIYEVATIMQDSPERTVLYKKLNRMVGEDVGALLGFNRKSHVLYQARLKNLRPLPLVLNYAQYLDVK